MCTVDDGNDCVLHRVIAPELHALYKRRWQAIEHRLREEEDLCDVFGNVYGSCDCEISRSCEVAVPMICARIWQLQKRWGLDIKVRNIGPVVAPQAITIELDMRIRATHRRLVHLVIWVNADDGLTAGGRVVEAGFGPIYYGTADELTDAILCGLKQIASRQPPYSPVGNPQCFQGADVEGDAYEIAPLDEECENTLF